MAAQFEYDPAGRLSAHMRGGETVFTAEYDAYGRATRRTDGMGESEHYAYAANGLCYMRARYYSPEMGRFVNEDPIRESLK